MKTAAKFYRLISLLLVAAFAVNPALAGISIVKSSGITLTGADGITLTGADGITLTGADGFLSYRTNGITLTGADGTPLAAPNGITLTGADGATYTGADGITLTGADGITLTGADGITLTGADGITLTGADGQTYRADSIVIRRPNGITLTGADGITLTGVDGFTRAGADGITLTGADGITLTGADGITLTGADAVIGYHAGGTAFTLVRPDGISLTGADGITLTGADGITLTGADGITLTGVDRETTNNGSGLQSVDAELAIRLDELTDDSGVNAVLVFHQYPTSADLDALRALGILSGTLYRVLPMIMTTATRAQIIAASRLPNVRSIYGNRTLTFDSDPYFNRTAVQRVATDRDLQARNAGLPVSGRGVTVAVLDTGINAQHPDLAGRVAQNVRLADTQGAGVGFVNPLPVENLPNTDLASGHGTFVAGVVAASGVSSAGRFAGVAPGARLLGLSAGDANLTQVLAGFDYVLERGAQYDTRVVNCSFSANTVYDEHDPVNIATRMLTDRGVSVVFSAGNAGAGNGTLNPYAVAPWVLSVGATDERGRLAPFSSRGVFASSFQNPSLVAPGVNVVGLRAVATQTGTLGVGLGADAQRLTVAEMPFYTTASGTSFSAPVVAGAIALMLEANPQLTPAEIKEILQRSATPRPLTFRHETGAGLLNAYAAVIEAADPSRRTGLFRAVAETRAIGFSNSVAPGFQQTATPDTPTLSGFSIPENTVQATVTIGWSFGPNDLALRVYDANNALRGESNVLNLTGLTGRREKVVLANPSAGNYQTSVAHTANVGTQQNFYGHVEIARVDYRRLSDLSHLTAETRPPVLDALRSFVMLPQGRVFRPGALVTRAELAATFVRSGTVLQFVAREPLYTDVADACTRNFVESAQAGGRLIYDAPDGGQFRPDAAASRLVAAVALVKAAGLENSAAAATLSPMVADFNQIPAEWRGHVAVALQRGFLRLENQSFNPSRPLTRLELALAIGKINRL